MSSFFLSLFIHLAFGEASLELEWNGVEFT